MNLREPIEDGGRGVLGGGLQVPEPTEPRERPFRFEGQSLGPPQAGYLTLEIAHGHRPSLSEAFDSRPGSSCISLHRVATGRPAACPDVSGTRDTLGAHGLRAVGSMLADLRDPLPRGFGQEQEPPGDAGGLARVRLDR